MNAAIGKRVSYDQGCLKSVRKLPDYVSGKFLDLMSRVTWITQPVTV